MSGHIRQKSRDGKLLAAAVVKYLSSIRPLDGRGIVDFGIQHNSLLAQASLILTLTRFNLQNTHNERCFCIFVRERACVCRAVCHVPARPVLREHARLYSKLLLQRSETR